MKKYKIGYTAGTFDLFHIGHLNLLKHAKEQCEYLIVGVNSNELVQKYKNKKPVISQIDRVQIVEAIKYVDKAEIVNSLDKIEAYKKFGFDVVFIGDDWKGNERWIKTEKDLNKIGVKVEFLSYTQSISTTKIKESIEKNKREKDMSDDDER